MGAPESLLSAQECGTEADAEQDLLGRALGGDQHAFRRLYDLYFRRIYHFLHRRLRNRADTEEATQEVFFNVFASLDSYRGDAPFAAWVFGITRRTLAARFKKKRHPTVPLLDEEPEGKEWIALDAGDPLAAYECRERIERLEAAMARDLSAEQLEVVRLHHLQSRTINEIAAALSKSEDAVKSHLYRARKVLMAR